MPPLGDLRATLIHHRVLAYRSNRNIIRIQRGALPIGHISHQSVGATTWFHRSQPPGSCKHYAHHGISAGTMNKGSRNPLSGSAGKYHKPTCSATALVQPRPYPGHQPPHPRFYIGLTTDKRGAPSPMLCQVTDLHSTLGWGEGVLYALSLETRSVYVFNRLYCHLPWCFERLCFFVIISPQSYFFKERKGKRYLIAN